MTFKHTQYERVKLLLTNDRIFYGDKGNGYYKNKQYPFILHDKMNNLYTPLSNEIIKYFQNNNICWWGGRSPTNHPLSSQISCLNHLFPIRDNKAAVLAILGQLVNDVVDVLPITTDTYNPAYIQFESVSKNDHLNEKTLTRGSNCTSIDALIYGVHKDGRKILFPIEWKFVEEYKNDNKANGPKGETRKGRYTDLINNSAQLNPDGHDVYYYEPFYQLMRQTLWAEQMVEHKRTETIKADDYIHIHVIPSENNELLNKHYLCSGKKMEQTWRSLISAQNKYVIIKPQTLLEPIDRTKYKDLLEYLKIRYWEIGIS